MALDLEREGGFRPRKGAGQTQCEEPGHRSTNESVGRSPHRLLVADSSASPSAGPSSTERTQVSKEQEPWSSKGALEKGD